MQIHGDNKGSPDQYLSPYEHDTQCNVFNNVQQTDSLCDTAEMLHMTLLNCILPSFLSTVRKQGEEKNKHILSLTHTNIHTSRPVKLRVGLSAAYNKLLENAVLPVFFLLLFAMCVWSCACIEKKKRRKWKSACVCTVCVSVSEIHRETNRRVWYVCVCVYTSVAVD